MPIKVDAYTVTGKASGTPARPGHLRDILEQSGELALQDVRWLPLGATQSQAAGDLTIAIDDVLIAVTDGESSIPVHASWHALRIDVGPYVVEGELPTLPGYDPDRALARPNGEFVLLRDPRLGLVGSQTLVAIGGEALVNRYGVERVEADIMLGFFFPGAVLPDMVEHGGLDGFHRPPILRQHALFPGRQSRPRSEVVLPGEEGIVELARRERRLGEAVDPQQ